jgi:hypothetical protein
VIIYEKKRCTLDKVVNLGSETSVELIDLLAVETVDAELTVDQASELFVVDCENEMRIMQLPARES